MFTGYLVVAWELASLSDKGAKRINECKQLYESWLHHWRVWTLTSSQDILYSAKTVRQRAAILREQRLKKRTKTIFLRKVRLLWLFSYTGCEQCQCSSTNFTLTLILRRTKGYIDGATTRLCIPAKKRAIRVIQLIVKKGWFHNEEKKETCRMTLAKH